MAKLKFDELGKRFYETGVSEAVLFPQDASGAYPLGVAWNGITAANESPSGAEANDQYADNIKYLSLTGAENFEGTIEAFSSPAEFDECDGMKSIVKGAVAHQQNRRPFGFAFKSILGNDTKGMNLDSNSTCGTVVKLLHQNVHTLLLMTAQNHKTHHGQFLQLQ